MVFWGDETGLPTFYKGWSVSIGGKYNANNSQDASIQQVLQWLQEYMSVDTVTLLVPTKDDQNLAVYATIGLEEEIAQKIRIPIGRGIAGRIAATMKPVIIDNLSEVEVVSPVLRQKDLKSLVGIPIPIQQGKVGVLHVGTLESHNFTERDVQQLELVAHHISEMISDQELLNCRQGNYNQESWLASKRDVSTLNFSALKNLVLKLIGFAQNWINLQSTVKGRLIFLTA